MYATSPAFKALDTSLPDACAHRQKTSDVMSIGISGALAANSRAPLFHIRSTFEYVTVLLATNTAVPSLMKMLDSIEGQTSTLFDFESRYLTAIRCASGSLKCVCE